MSDIVKVLRGKYALDYDEKTLDQFCNEAADEIEKLRAALNKISKLNSRRDRYSQEIEDVIIAALGEKE